ncbi:hypothetical protein GGR52DRAFT_564007 [Hypoxylon sp. FL1284]|nr:hypothetical protein GGR52DRAFT_564007 [Hypoxylon sp. FL1284]
MSLCKALRPSSARHSRRVTTLPACFNRRSFASRYFENPSRPNTVPPEPNSDEQSASGRDDVFKVNTENKTVETVIGDLPLSPVMDPTFWEATQRHQTPKAKPGKPQNSVERQLRANPFALALATPIRRCAMTFNRMPSFFLQHLNFVAHPETGVPYLVPRTLLPDEPVSAQKSKTKTETSPQVADEPTSDPAKEAADSLELSDSADSADPAVAEDEGPRGSATYLLARRDFFAAFATKHSGWENGHRQIAGKNPRHKTLANKLAWRKDMDTYVLGLMRQDIVTDLLYISRLCAEEGRHYIVKCYGWGDVQYKHKGSVLWFGEPEEGGTSDQTGNEPGPFATFDMEKVDIQGETMTETVAVHNMLGLLGAEQAGRLKQEAAPLKDGSIFMLAGRRTTVLQSKLWKLQGYMLDFKDV